MTLKKVNKKKKLQKKRNKQKQSKQNDIVKYFYFSLNDSFCCKTEISCLSFFFIKLNLIKNIT